MVYCPKDEDQMREYMTSEVVHVINSYGFDELKSDLWKLTKTVTTEHSSKKKKIDFTKLIKALDQLVEGSWQLLEIRKRCHFTHPSLQEKWVMNPFRQQDDDRDFYDKKRNSHLACFQGEINFLTKKETHNFFRTLKHFFAVRNVIDWKRLFVQWNQNVYHHCSITGDGWDDEPLSTYEQLMKLI